MATVLDKRYTDKDADDDILRAIHKLASDRNTRILNEDALEWERRKLKEIKRLSKILVNRTKNTLRRVGYWDGI